MYDYFCYQKWKLEGNFGRHDECQSESSLRGVHILYDVRTGEEEGSAEKQTIVLIGRVSGTVTREEGVEKPQFFAEVILERPLTLFGGLNGLLPTANEGAGGMFPRIAIFLRNCAKT